MDSFEPIYDWIVSVQEPVVWICQPPRSGGTLLLRLLDSHPQVHTYPSVFGFDNKEMIWPSTDELSAAPEALLDGLFERMNLAKFNRVGLSKKSSNMIQKKYPIYFDESWFKSIFLRWFEFSENGRSQFNALFTAIFNAWRNYQSLYFPKKYVIGHMTMRWTQLSFYVENFINFQKTYPDGYMIFIVREPDDWMASFTKLREATPYSGDPNDAARFYKTYYQSAEKLLKSNQLIIIQFRDLILDSKMTLHKLTERLNIQWNPLILYPTFNGAPWYQNSSFDLDRKAQIDASVIGKGKELTGAEKKAVDSEMWDLYSMLSSQSDL